MTDLEELRIRIQDYLRWIEKTFTGDGSATVFELPVSPVANLSVSGASGYTLYDNAGQLVFAIAPTNGDEFTVKCQYAAFIDSELNDILAQETTIIKSAIYCIKILLADAAKRFTYTQGETKIEAGEVNKHLQDLLKELQKEMTGVPRIVKRIHPAYQTSRVKTDISRLFLGKNKF